MAKLSIREIYDVARSAGFTPEQAVTWSAIAMAESGGRTGALNDRGEHSVGLWQVNVDADPGRRTRWGNLNDPAANARAAYEISGHGRDMRPWTTTHAHNKGTARDYRTYMPEVEQVIGVEGDDRGVGGYHSVLPTNPVASSSSEAELDGAAWEMPRGRSLALLGRPVDDPDSDADGLTNSFENLAGTKIGKIDSDDDGLSDTHEALRSHTDPLSADTDGDGNADAAEILHRTPAGTVPGVGGVVGTGLLAENFRRIKDADGDGLSDFVERRIGTDGKSRDSDKDGAADGLEVSLGTNPLDADTDDDGITDQLEYRQGTNALAAGSSARNTVPTWTMEAAAAALAAGSQTDTSVAGTSGALDTFLTSARNQIGDPYVYGAQLQPGRDNPVEFDCSSLTAWAAGQAGVKLPRTAEEQYRLLKSQGLLVPVDQAVQTKGALLFYFSVEPAGQLSAGNAHVAISDGEGCTIEAKNSDEGVGTWSAKGRFNYAALIPGISDPDSLGRAAPDGGAEQNTVTSVSAASDMADQGAAWEMPQGRSLRSALDGDRDRDGLSDTFEGLLGTKRTVLDSDEDGLSDAQEVTRTRTDPTRADTDGDGQTDGSEVAASTAAGRVPGRGGVVGMGRYADRFDAPDADHDGLSDRVERRTGLKANQADSDGDGLRDGLEISLGTDPLRADTDGDGLTDRLEYRYGLDPLVAGSSMRGRQPELGEGVGADGTVTALGMDPAAAGGPGVGSTDGPDLG